MQKFSNSVSQVGDVRPLAACQFSPDGTRLVTGSWVLCLPGEVDVPTCRLATAKCGRWRTAATSSHCKDTTVASRMSPSTRSYRCVDLHFHRHLRVIRRAAAAAQDENSVSVATCAADTSVLLWALKGSSDMSECVPRLSPRPLPDQPCRARVCACVPIARPLKRRPCSPRTPASKVRVAQTVEFAVAVAM